MTDAPAQDDPATPVTVEPPIAEGLNDPWGQLEALLAPPSPAADQPAADQPATQATPDRPDPAPANPVPPISPDPPPRPVISLEPAAGDAPALEPARADDTLPFFDQEPAPFRAYRNIQRIGIIGGRGVGKSYLFQAMVYRAQHARRAGVLSHFLDRAGIMLTTTLSRDEPGRSVNLHHFNADYAHWTRLPTTLATHQPWYRLTLPYRTGMLGRTRAALEVEFFDGSGEQFFEARDPHNRPIWEQAYGDARVMVFCLPLWAAFPGDEVSAADLRERDSVLGSFFQVVQNYHDLRRQLGRREPVRSLLVLTMADDRRSALKALRENWIAGYLQRHEQVLDQTRRGWGIARYLANARQVSAILMAEFARANSPSVAQIPERLVFDGDLPWLIPVSAIHGEVLAHVEAEYPNPDTRPPRPPPIPAHVELPLLVALCERTNALM